MTNPIIGWKEWVNIPELGIKSIKAKIDTGARSSVLHTAFYEIYNDNDLIRVRFKIHPISRSTLEVMCDTELTGLKSVKDSGGHVELRPFIKTNITIGETSYTIELNLTNRESMRYRMLLGRTAITNQFLVDSSKCYLQGKNK